MSGSKREQRDRDCGLTFSWRSPESSGWSTCVAVVVVSVVATGLLGAVRIRIAPPPQIIERHASMVLVPESIEAGRWSVSVDEQGPFPAKFDPSSDRSFRDLEGELATQTAQRAPYRSNLRDFPQEVGVPGVAVSLRGARVFPEEAITLAAKSTTLIEPLAPSVVPLFNLPDAAWPEKLPEFAGEISPAMSAKSWRFMIEIGLNGRVIQRQSIESGDDEAGRNAIRRLEDWISRVRFGPSAKPGWIGVEISFNRNH
ncbi:MAG: hypothetical protein WCH40_03810 [Verrucomicrobiales bacterium]